ncbi:MAG TPA: hypothetical protein VE987_10875, partial [Polyangiaceae bacterium]|nr:hypothetical protein [Polyangiaceae bacterium]
DAFDSAYLGMLFFPSSDVPAPACLMGLVPTVTCGVSGLAQVPLQLAGMNKSSDSSGVRHDIYQQLVALAPAVSDGNGNPSYDAIHNGIGVLQGWPKMGKRVLFFITDGGASCTSVSMPQRAAYTDANGCPDWENPQNIIDMVKAAHDDMNTPVNTIVVGVPGADTTGQDPTSQPPYSVKQALSAEAWAGSPETCPMTCNGKTYTSMSTTDPTMPCHFDLSAQPNFTQALTSAIDAIRGQLLGCTFDLPVPDGGMIDLNKVNVEYSLDGGMHFTQLYKRAMPSETCTSDGCWDYTNNQTQVQLIGKACTDVTGNPNADVQIVVGCQTVIK